MSATQSSRARAWQLAFSTVAFAASTIVVAPCKAQDDKRPEEQEPVQGAPVDASERPADGRPAGVIGGGLSPVEPTERAVPKVLHRIRQDGTAMRCFGSEQSPVYGEVLAAGTVVEVLETSAGFQRIRLPEGPLGYVHGDFVTAPDLDGMVRTDGRGVSFRYRPKADEAPVARMQPSTKLAIVGRAERDAAWWKVRFADAPVWVPADGIEPIGADEYDRASAAWRALGDTMRADTREWAKQKAIAEAAEAAAAARKQQFDALRDRFVAEARVPVAEQDFAPILSEIEAYSAALEQDAPERTALDQLRTDVQRLEDRRRATMFVRKPDAPPAKPADLPPAAPRDPLAAYDAVGWIRVRSRITPGPVRVTLEKGGTIRFYLKCTTGRFDLTQFDGLEVALSGPTERPHLESVRTLDVETIVVVGVRN